MTSLELIPVNDLAWCLGVRQDKFVARLRTKQVARYGPTRGANVMVGFADLPRLLTPQERDRFTDLAASLCARLDVAASDVDGGVVDGARFMAVVDDLRELYDPHLALLIALAPESSKGRVEFAVTLARAAKEVRSALREFAVTPDMAESAKACLRHLADTVVDESFASPDTIDDYEAV